MTYHIITIGCQMNKADSERVAAFLEARGYTVSQEYQRADLVILTTCGIRQSAEDRVYGLVNQIRKKNKNGRLIITGCLANRLDVQRRLAGRVTLFLPISQLPNLFNLLTTKLAAINIDQQLKSRLKGEKYLKIKPKHNNSFSAFVPIGNGCNNFCAYCVVPYARGPEVYRPAKEIIEEVKKLIKQGYREINLIAQNVNSYKSDQVNFPQLLQDLIAIPGDFWLRFSSSHPKDLSPALIKVMAYSDKVCHHLHLALQAGDNQVLANMNRQYTAQDFITLIKKIRRAKPGIAITTDVIVGFPGETKSQFLKTVKIFQELEFDMAYISQFSPRPGTAAWKLKDNVNRLEKKRREQVLEAILRNSALKNNQRYLGKTIKILVEAKNKQGQYYGKSSSFKTVIINSLVVKKSANLIGQFVEVKITQVKEFILSGELLEKKKTSSL